MSDNWQKALIYKKGHDEQDKIQNGFSSNIEESLKFFMKIFFFLNSLIKSILIYGQQHP